MTTEVEILHVLDTAVFRSDSCKMLVSQESCRSKDLSCTMSCMLLDVVMPSMLHSLTISPSSDSFWSRSMATTTAETATFAGRVPMCGVFRAQTRLGCFNLFIFSPPFPSAYNHVRNIVWHYRFTSSSFVEHARKLSTHTE